MKTMRRVAEIALAVSCVLLSGRAFVEPALGASPFVFREVLVSPLPARPGDTVEIRVRFEVAGRPTNLTARVEPTTGQVGPPPPTVLLGELAPGEYTRLVYSFRVPSPVLGRSCFSIKIGPGEVRGLCLRPTVDGTGRTLLELESRGSWGEAIPGPQPVPSAEKPDLKWIGRLAFDETFRLENVGPGTAHNIHVKKRCLVDGRWLPTGGDKEIPTLGPGASLPLPLGKFGRMAFGQCATNVTRIRIVADPENLIDELDEANNIMESEARPDLKILQFTCAPTPGPSPGSLAYNAFIKIHNTGPGDAGRFAWEISVLRRQDGGAGAPAWTSFMGMNVDHLAVGETKTIVKPLVGQVERLSRLRLRIDVRDDLLEIDEANNSAECSIPYR